MYSSGKLHCIILSIVTAGFVQHNMCQWSLCHCQTDVSGWNRIGSLLITSINGVFWLLARLYTALTLTWYSHVFKCPERNVYLPHHLLKFVRDYDFYFWKIKKTYKNMDPQFKHRSNCEWNIDTERRLVYFCRETNQTLHIIPYIMLSGIRHREEDCWWIFTLILFYGWEILALAPFSNLPKLLPNCQIPVWSS